MAEEFDTSPSSWLRRIMETQDVEIYCTECLDLISVYVDMELKTSDAAARLSQLVHHLDQCPACWETYQVLQELARLEAQGRLPLIQELVERLKRDK